MLRGPPTRFSLGFFVGGQKKPSRPLFTRCKMRKKSTDLERKLPSCQEGELSEKLPWAPETLEFFPCLQCWSLLVSYNIKYFDNCFDNREILLNKCSNRKSYLNKLVVKMFANNTIFNHSHYVAMPNERTNFRNLIWLIFHAERRLWATEKNPV